jgi:hypothetical protein
MMTENREFVKLMFSLIAHSARSENSTSLSPFFSFGRRRTRLLLPSPLGRRAGDEGYRSMSYYRLFNSQSLALAATRFDVYCEAIS